MKKTSQAYTGFADIYDQIMCSVDYEAWADYVEQLLVRFAKKPRSIVDLACGTGSSTLPFAYRGYQTAGVDLSPAMLERARSKTAQKRLPVKFYEQNLCRLELPEKYDLALLFQDGLNYLLSEQQLIEAINQVYSALNPASLFIFDLTRPSLRSGGDTKSLSWADQDDFTLIVESSYSSKEDLWSAHLTVFQQTTDGLYKKFQENHHEKDHEPDLVTRVLEKTGFKILGTYPSFSLEPSANSDPKLTFVAETKSA